MPSTLHSASVVLPMAAEPIRDGAVLVEDDRIVAVGPRAELASAGARERVWRGVLTPGLVNAHAHLQYTDFGDLALSGLAFPEWIRTLTERRSTFSEVMWQESARRGVHHMLRSGTTAAADVVTDPCVLVPVGRSGLRGISYVEVIADDAMWAAGGRREAFLSTLRGASGGRELGVSPHTPYTVGTAVFEECAAIARERGLRLHPHLAETAHEAEFIRYGTGRFAELNRAFGMALELLDGGSGGGPAAYLDGFEGLGSDVHVAHGVHLAADDRALLRERGTAVALCVRSNAILAAGEPPIADYLAEGSPIALGTDSLASSPSLDMWEEAAAARELAVRQGYAGADLDRRLVEAVTVGGAAAMGGLAGAGTLGAGGLADLAVFDVPTDGDPYAALVAHGTGSCVATVLGGRLVHRR
ncbi:amidohydrolase family protein [Streptomyces sp. SID3343]|uniref:amidohydrolase family protein n=1 Tax=Streptomyces sp. SID3343 TaxID=2690260 RepID=UPI001370AFA1|nr:amidohydrolase family protein [Streptomyces sp. SID3343]MYV97522.1 amidohydrolase family protein [Streptomyces sp. SID3343]